MIPPSIPLSIEEWTAQLPKVETHVHLEGSIEPSTLHELALRHKLPHAEWSEADIVQRYEYADFREFINTYLWVVSHLKGPEDYAHIARRFAQNLKAQNVRHVEVILSAGMMIERSLDPREIMAEVQREFEESQKAGGPSYRFFFDITRQFGPDKGWRVLEAALACRDVGVAGIGLGGDEIGGPAVLFEAIYARARAEGLVGVAHAGEWAGPESVWDAIEKLKAIRIGHGVAAARDERLLDRIGELGVAIECCPTSNEKTRSLRRLEDHPLRRFLDCGLMAGIHSDDPPLFHTSLTEEIRTAANRLGLSRAEIVTCQHNAIEGTVLSKGEKEQLRRDLDQWTGSNY